MVRCPKLFPLSQGSLSFIRIYNPFSAVVAQRSLVGELGRHPLVSFPLKGEVAFAGEGLDGGPTGTREEEVTVIFRRMGFNLMFLGQKNRLIAECRARDRVGVQVDGGRVLAGEWGDKTRQGKRQQQL